MNIVHAGAGFVKLGVTARLKKLLTAEVAENGRRGRGEDHSIAGWAWCIAESRQELRSKSRQRAGCSMLVTKSPLLRKK